MLVAHMFTRLVPYRNQFKGLWEIFTNIPSHGKFEGILGYWLVILLNGPAESGSIGGN